MTVRSRILVSKTAIATGVSSSIVYTVPPGSTALVKRVVIQNTSVASTTVWVGRGGAGANNTANFKTFTPLQDMPIDYETWWVFDAGSTINALALNGGQRISVMGALLSS